jgi:hypothetical protein
MNYKVLEYCLWKTLFVFIITTFLLTIAFIPFSLINILTCNDGSYVYVTNITNQDVYECNVVMSSEDNKWQASKLMLCINSPKIGDKLFVQFNHYFGKATCFQVITDPKNREIINYKYYHGYIYCLLSFIFFTSLLFYLHKLICRIVDKEEKIMYGISKKLCDEV